jgi:hypothetical protein
MGTQMPQILKILTSYFQSGRRERRCRRWNADAADYEGFLLLTSYFFLQEWEKGTQMPQMERRCRRL